MSADHDTMINPGPDMQFQHFLGLGEFRLQQCSSCREFIFYPRVLCPHCGGEQLQWQPVSGAGVVYSTTVVRRREEKGGPYNVAIIELEEGARMMSRVEGIAADQVAIGAAVSARIVDDAKTPGRKVIVFDPHQASGGRS